MCQGEGVKNLEDIICKWPMTSGYMLKNTQDFITEIIPSQKIDHLGR